MAHCSGDGAGNVGNTPRGITSRQRVVFHHRYATNDDGDDHEPLARRGFNRRAFNRWGGPLSVGLNNEPSRRFIQSAPLCVRCRARTCRQRTCRARRTRTCASRSSRTRSTGSRRRSSGARSTRAGTRPSTSRVSRVPCAPFHPADPWRHLSASGGASENRPSFLSLCHGRRSRASFRLRAF